MASLDFALAMATSRSPAEPVAERRRRLPGQQPADLEVAIHLGAVMLHGLEAADRPVELHARLGVVQREIERGLADADQLGGLQRRAAKQQPRDMRPRAARLADDGVGIDRDAVEHHLPQRLAARGLQPAELQRPARRAGPSASVRSVSPSPDRPRQMMASAAPASRTNSLVPLIVKPLPAGVMRVRISPGASPPPGSVIAVVRMASPAAMRGR